MTPAFARRLGDKQLQRWIRGYARHLARRARTPAVRGPRHLLFAVCDHFEPLWGKPTHAEGERRVEAWRRGYPELAAAFRDADGRPPRHTFFFPGEEYAPSYLEKLGELARRGLGEVELHLHHDGDTAEKLRATIGEYVAALARHGHLGRDAGGRPRYAFIHGNWALSNARADGRWCGVDDELPVLFETGCFADFTFPAAPSECQPDIVNRIYWPVGDLAARRAYERGAPARVGEVRRDRLLMIEGPLALARRPRTLAVRIDAGAVDAGDPPTATRLATWTAQHIHVEGRPEWVFVKVHTHGAPERNARVLLGAPARHMHEELARRYNDGRSWILHYVTAREMFNIAIAAMEGKDGDPNPWRDHIIPPPPVSR